MQRKYLVLAILALAAVLFLTIGYAAALNRLNGLLCQKMEEALHRRVTIGLLWFTFPNQLKMRGLKVFEKGDSEDVFINVSSVAVGVDPRPFFSRNKIGIDLRLSSPQVFVERTGWTKLNIADVFKAGKDIEPKKTDESRRASAVEISSLVISDGKLLFLDKEVDEKGFQTRFEGIDVTMLSSSFGFGSTKEFEVSADICDIQNLKRGKLEASGWADVKLKNMEGEFSINELDLYHFQPYLNPILPPVESGKLGFAVEVSSKDNDLSARCKLKVEDFRFLASAKEAKQPPDDPAESPSKEETPEKEGIFGAILKSTYAEAIESLKTADDKLEVDFEVKGKMDAPGKVLAKVGGNIMSRTLGSSIKVQIGGKIVAVGKGILGTGKKGAEAVVDKTGKVGEIAGDAGEQIKQVGKELKETFEEVLK